MAQDFLDNLSQDDKKKLIDTIVDKVKETKQDSTKRQLAKVKKRDLNKKSTGKKNQGLTTSGKENNQNEAPATRVGSSKNNLDNKKDQKGDNSALAGQTQNEDFKNDNFKNQDQHTNQTNGDAESGIDQTAKSDAEDKINLKPEEIKKGVENRNADKDKEDNKDQGQGINQPTEQQKEVKPQDSRQTADPNLKQSVDKVAPEQEQEKKRQFTKQQTADKQNKANEVSQIGKEGAGLPKGENFKGMSARDIMKQYSDIRKQADAKGASEVSSTIKDVVYKGSQEATKQLLKAAWENVPDSVGLTLIYVELHFFCRYIFSLALPGLKDIFCPMGQEWLPTLDKAEELGQIGEVAKKFDIGSKAIEWLEIGVIVLANLIVIFALYMILGMIYIIVDAIENPWENRELLWEGAKALWDEFWH
ncbi:MAG: hypothetical protein PHS07_03955 [Patescibacteria group bacterium]|nr:hypothetical protein [Patescibacteria group bacterium]